LILSKPGKTNKNLERTDSLTYLETIHAIDVGDEDLLIRSWSTLRDCLIIIEAKQKQT